MSLLDVCHMNLTTLVIYLPYSINLWPKILSLDCGPGFSDSAPTTEVLVISLTSRTGKKARKAGPSIVVELPVLQKFHCFYKSDLAKLVMDEERPMDFTYKCLFFKNHIISCILDKNIVWYTVDFWNLRINNEKITIHRFKSILKCKWCTNKVNIYIVKYYEWTFKQKKCFAKTPFLQKCILKGIMTRRRHCIILAHI